MKHHLFLYAQENDVCAVEAGHFSTEDVVVNPLKLKLSDKFPEVEFIKSESLIDPVYFC
jgi:putative NIF3 family GTP cyclohydrolase 1 type 2